MLGQRTIFQVEARDSIVVLLEELQRRAADVAGGGVVADSDPTAEYYESCNKAAALLRAIEEAERLSEPRVRAYD